MNKLLLSIICVFCCTSLFGQETFSNEKIDNAISSIELKVIEWRRFFHQNPELSNREFKTGLRIASELRRMGMEVQTRVAHTGVVGILKGNQPGPVVALRADIDALPVTERVELPFKSKVKSEHNGIETGVMHACGHDAHTAILLGVAEVLSQHKDLIKGTIKFIFQPAEEGVPIGEEGGAKMMVQEGVLTNPDVDAIFGLHIAAGLPVGKIAYKPEGTMAAVDRFIIKITGKQTHGSAPWNGNDPIVAASQIINNLQTVVSREADLTTAPAVVTVGKIQAGVRYNIIPETAELIGTIRTLDSDEQEKIHKSINRVVTNTAKALGTEATVKIEAITPVTYNDSKLTSKSINVLNRAFEKENVLLIKPVTGGEDFAYYQQKVPGFYFFLGASINPESKEGVLSGHHSPDFQINEEGLIIGVKALLNLTMDYMETPLDN